MGEDVETREFSRQDRQLYREKLRSCLDVFARMLGEAKFDFERPLTGLEIEFNLVAANQDPAMENAKVLEAIANADFQTELGQFNIEINVPPRSLVGRAADELEAELRASLNSAEDQANSVGAHIVMVGILPTLMPEHVTGESLSANPRYQLINEQVFAARGEDLYIAIDGPERLATHADTIAPEAACTSVQFHLQVSPQEYAPNWNAAQCLAGVQLALGANSPFLFGKELWRETRVALFEQATDTRPQELKEQGVRPRVWFGERWITSVFDQFEENVRYFPSLLPVCDAEDPVDGARPAATPRGWASCACTTARSTAGTGRCTTSTAASRTCASRTGCCPPGRRWWTSSPTARSTTARCARSSSRTGRSGRRCRSPPRSTTSSPGARRGIDAHLYWPGLGEVPATELVLRRLLPMAREGLAAWGVDTAVSDRLLGIIEGRCTTHQNGAEWQSRMFHRIDEKNQPLDRRDSLRAMLAPLRRPHAQQRARPHLAEL